MLYYKKQGLQKVFTFRVEGRSAIRKSMTLKKQQHILLEHSLRVCCWVTTVSTRTILKPQYWHCDTTMSQSSPSTDPAAKPLLLPWLAVDRVYSAVSLYFIYCCGDLVPLVSLVTGAVASVLFCPIKLLLHCVSEWASYCSWSHNIKTRCEYGIFFQLFLDSTRSCITYIYTNGFNWPMRKKKWER